MKQEQKKKELLDYLYKKAFEDVLDASEKRYDSEAKKGKLREIKEKTEFGTGTLFPLSVIYLYS